MIIFTVRRSLLLLVTSFLLSLIGFSPLQYTPQEPLNGAGCSMPIVFISAACAGRFWVSSTNGQPISEQLREVLPATVEVSLLAFLLLLLVGIPLGITTGVMQHKAADRIISGLALLGFLLPVFWLALLMTLFFFLHLGWLPVSGRFELLYPALMDAWFVHSPYREEMIASAIQHMILPVLVLSVGPTTEVVRLMRISTTDVGTQNYIKAAIIRGLPRATVIRRHLLHNALPPIIPQLGLQFSTMLTLEMITEVVFNWPGIGGWLVNAIRQQDFAAISAGVMVVGALVITINVLSDILGAMANPLKHKEWYALR
uniref:SapB protein n=1 Tax=Dickeya chrysanthemi TaxID=556 RepID=O86188_DICCH|nr:sapB [Dickeya chrysanthemi]